MIEATLADLRSPKQMQQWHDVVHLVDARKNNAVGYFVPQSLSPLFEPFLQQIEAQRKTELLNRIAAAQLTDPIEEGALADGLV
jgi:hypothetical protein